MIAHLFKIIWNRKRVNALIMIEMCISFIVVFAICTTVVFHLNHYIRPTGFNCERVWRVNPDPKLPFVPAYNAARVIGKRELYRGLQGLPGVESLAGCMTFPYSNTASISNFEIAGKSVQFEVGEVTDDYDKVFDLQLLAGRWFDKSDDASGDKPIVINERMRHEIYGDDNPVGTYLDCRNLRKARIIGVVSEFRSGGEFSEPNNFMFQRIRLDDTSSHGWWGFVVKLKPGSSGSLQGKLHSTLAAIEPGWSFDITSIDNMRDENFQEHLAPLIWMGLIGVFLLIMVGFGLTGVLWQNVSQRTREIGLRRAIGGTAQSVFRQILGELFVIATMGIIAGSGIIFQAPLLNLIAIVTPDIFTIGFLVALVFMYGLTLISGLYPSRLAMAVHPSEALRYE